jgi:succinate dehydrogenase / fumarate reductase iron-sulfur subunit
MEKKLRILRQSGHGAAPFWQTFSYQFMDCNETVANALTHLNQQVPLHDIDGTPAEQVSWQCSCLQKKCGACAMRIDGVPRLACDTKLIDCSGDIVLLEPLKKFPVVRDLLVDRAILFENLKLLNAWFTEEAKAECRDLDDIQMASGCLQCGLCLEVCPNFLPGGTFLGMAAGVPLSRLILELPEVQKKEIYRSYRKHIYAGCGKSLSCHKICPAAIDTEHLMSRSNGAAVWRRHA